MFDDSRFNEQIWISYVTYDMSMAHWQCFIGFYLFERYVDVNLQKCALKGFKFMKARYKTLYFYTLWFFTDREMKFVIQNILFLISVTFAHEGTDIIAKALLPGQSRVQTVWFTVVVKCVSI